MTLEASVCCNLGGFGLAGSLHEVGVEARILYAPHAALRRQFSRSRLAAFLGESRCGAFFFRWRAIIGLAGSDIDDQLTELARVARALETTGCHAGNMA
jgi:hypothetical protein